MVETHVYVCDVCGDGLGSSQDGLDNGLARHK
jgi:hypothetical protein